MTLDLDLSELRAVASRIDSAGPRIGAAASLALRRTAFAIQADAQVSAPVDTGNLRASISTTISGDGRFGEMTAEIGPTANYGFWVEHGTDPHAIPNAWGRGSDFGSDEGFHPGTPAQPYMGPAFDRQVPGYTSSLAQLAAEQVL